MCCSDVVVNPATEEARKNGLSCRLCQSAFRAGQRDVNGRPIGIAHGQDQRKLRRALIAFIGKANPDRQNAGKRIPVRQHLRQDRGTKCLRLTWFHMAFEQGKSRDHGVQLSVRCQYKGKPMALANRLG
jgi:hypothetical protein